MKLQVVSVIERQRTLDSKAPCGVQEILEAKMQDTLETVLAGKGAAIHYVIPETTVLDAVGKMNEERIGALLVCISGEMVGIFTERDVLCRVVGEGRVVAVRSTTSVEEAMAVFTEKRFRHLPVVDDGELKGLVSSGDLTRRMSRNQEGHIQDLMNFITGKYPG
jgi:CBS domain-containing protein